MTWRTFSRTAECYIMRELIVLARATGATRLVGEYVSTAKNGVVADLYPRLGFFIGSDGLSSATCRGRLTIWSLVSHPVEVQIAALIRLIVPVVLCPSWSCTRNTVPPQPCTRSAPTTLSMV